MAGKLAWRAVCQDCGALGGISNHVSGIKTDGPPAMKPLIAGYCNAHPSGKSNMPHRGEWRQIG